MQAQSMFGILIPGSTVQYNFEVIGDKGVLTIPNPKSINVVGFFLNQPLPDDNTGAALYFSPPPYDGLQFIGAIANQRPSDIFHTGFSLNPDVNTKAEIKLVVQIEPLANLETCVQISQENDLNKQFAKKNESTGSDGMLVVPMNTLDKWHEKFMRKYDLDPNFVFKTTE